MPENDRPFLRSGSGDGSRLLILAHGAGAPMDSRFMNVMADSIASLAGIEVLRFEFPYMARRREEGKRPAPDRAEVLLQSWRSVIARHRRDRLLFIGGKSLGGRMATMVADEQNAAGVICLGYPFHPPGRPEKLRTDHLETLRTPALFLQGERDPFGNREDVASYRLSPSIKMEWLPDGDHSLKPRARSGVSESENLMRAATAAADFIDARSRRARGCGS